jgi:hypothetical protein
VRGTLWAPRVEIWPGALFQGTFHLGRSPLAVAVEPAGRRAVAARSR